jgi:serine/threonine-protein kinase
MVSESHAMDKGASTAWNGEDVPRILGRYLLLKRIARGGMGEVFLASTTGIEGAERPVVVKIIRREHSKDPSFIARFLDEARVQAQLQHSGVAQVIDATVDEGTGEPYAVVEHVEGRSLGDLRQRAVQLGRAIGWTDAVAIGTLIAEALAHVHERQDPSGKALAIVHRDLSPQNVMVSYTGECKIIDFGTARGQNRRCHTVAGVVFAKPGYVAPEVANGDSGDARVDLYALGIMLWELCAGRRFLQGDASAHMTAVARNAKNPPPIAASCGAPAELDAIIEKLTAFDREARYRAGRTAAADLARCLSAADALPSGERGVRARVAHLMASLFPGEPGKTRREFAQLVAAAREQRAELPAPLRPSKPAPAPEKAPAPPPAAQAGDVLGGTRYKLSREIGRGASSVVFEAEHLDLGKRVALKIIDAALSKSSEIAARFRREARTLSRLSHEGLVAVHDVGVATDGRLFCVMELLEGETLEAFGAREKGMRWRDALAVADRVLAALEVAHGAALVHRDIKPANVFLPRVKADDPLAVKLLDFGLAKSLGERDEKKAGLSLFGTPEYMAPEQASMAEVDARADLYALGCVIYELVTGRLPFLGASAVAILDAKTKGSPERPRERAPAREIPAAVDALIMKALARHPSERFQTATEMRRAIEAALAAPQRSALRRFAGAGVIAAMALAAVVVLAKKPDLRAKLHLPKLGRAEATQVAAAAPKAEPPKAEAPEAPPAPVADAKPTEDGFDEGDDGDVADDTLPAAAVAAAPEAPAAEKAPEAASPAPEKQAAAEKPHGKKRGKGGKRAEVKPKATAESKPEDAAKADKPARRKHKAKVAHVQ